MTRVKLCDKYHNEREEICKKLIEITGNEFLLADIDENAEKQTAILALKDEIQKWLKEPVDCGAWESWPSGWSSQGRALSFFESIDADVVNALGVVIIEGDHPGSSYFAAELHASFEDANAAAKKLKLPFRFREQKT